MKEKPAVQPDNKTEPDMEIKPDTKTEPDAKTEPKKGKKPKRKASVGKTLLRILICLIIIAVGIFVVLFCVAKAAHYNSISAMLQHMSGELALMWERITA